MMNYLVKLLQRLLDETEVPRKLSESEANGASLLLIQML